MGYYTALIRDGALMKGMKWGVDHDTYFTSIPTFILTYFLSLSSFLPPLSISISSTLLPLHHYHYYCLSVQRLCVYVPENRSSAEQALSHPFVTRAYNHQNGLRSDSEHLTYISPNREQMPPVTVIPIAASNPPLEITDSEGLENSDFRHVTPDDLGTAFDDIACPERQKQGLGQGQGGVEGGEGQREGGRERQGQSRRDDLPVVNQIALPLTNAVESKVSKKAVRKGSAIHKEENDEKEKEKEKEREKEKEKEREKEGIKTRASNILGDIIAAEISTVTLPLVHPIEDELERGKEKKNEKEEKVKASRIEKKMDLGSDSVATVTQILPTGPVAVAVDASINAVSGNGTNNANGGVIVSNNGSNIVAGVGRGSTGVSAESKSDTDKGNVTNGSVTGGTAIHNPTTATTSGSVCGVDNSSNTSAAPRPSSPLAIVTVPVLPVVEGGRKRRNSVSAATTAPAAAGTAAHTTQGQTDTTQPVISTIAAASVSVAVNTRKNQKRRNSEDMEKEKEKEAAKDFVKEVVKEAVKQPKEVEKSRAKMRYSESDEPASVGAKTNVLGSAENWKKNYLSSSKKRILNAIEESSENGETMGRKTLNFDTKKSSKDREKEKEKEKEVKNENNRSKVQSADMENMSCGVSVNNAAGVSVGAAVKGNVGVTSGVAVNGDWKRKRESGREKDSGKEKEKEVGREGGRERGDSVSVMSASGSGEDSATTAERFSQDDFRCGMAPPGP
jgi:hypothetical protein